MMRKIYPWHQLHSTTWTISSPTSEYHINIKMISYYQLSQGFSPHWVTCLYISGLKVLILQWCHIIWNRPTFSATTKYNVALCDDRSIFFQHKNWIILNFWQFIYLRGSFHSHMYLCNSIIRATSPDSVQILHTVVKGPKCNIFLTTCQKLEV